MSLFHFPHKADRLLDFSLKKNNTVIRLVDIQRISGSSNNMDTTPQAGGLSRARSRGGCLVISSLCSRPALFAWKRCIVSLQQLACLHPILSFSSPPSDRYSYPLTAKTSFLPGRQRSAVFTLARRGAARSAAPLSGPGKHS